MLLRRGLGFRPLIEEAVFREILVQHGLAALEVLVAQAVQDVAHGDGAVLLRGEEGGVQGDILDCAARQLEPPGKVAEVHSA